MSKGEIFPKPLVKQVIFQIKFPNLFYLENKIGDIQLKLMNEFPESRLLLRKQILFGDIPSEEEKINLFEKGNDDAIKKIWQFNSKNNVQLNILADSLDITSEKHKSYDSPSAEWRFRDIIEFTLQNFFEFTKVPLLTRIGLRYINEFPLVTKDTETYKSYFNGAINTKRFEVEKLETLEFVSESKLDQGFSIRYHEAIKKDEGKGNIIILDFDASKENIRFEEYLVTVDALHQYIQSAFMATIRTPIIEYMRGH
jgi:uncharacterized protein (TIGR04255 family)